MHAIEPHRLRNDSRWIDRNPRPLDEDWLIDRWARVLSRRGTPGAPETLAVYVHVPYCRSYCRFCMYFTSARARPRQTADYVDYVVERLRRMRRRVGRQRADSLYIGGGTPSLLEVDELRRLLAALDDSFEVDGDSTMEGHPGSFTEEKVALAVRYGINRISLGIQSTDPEVLARVHRKNPSQDEMGRRLRAVIDRGAWLNVDLMIGLPGQSPEGTVTDLSRAIEHQPHSITLYRYQPVYKIGVEPGETQYGDLPRGRLMARSLARGYLPLVPRSANAFGATFLRARPHHRPNLHRIAERAVAFAHLFRSGSFKRPLPATARVKHFTGFDIPAVNIMGFGPRAMSHLYGGAWYRDESPVSSLCGTTPPQFRGTPICLEGELRRAMLADLAANRWLHSGQYAGSIGLDPLSLLRQVPRELQPALDIRRRRARLRKDHARGTEVLRFFLGLLVALQPEVADHGV